MASNLAAATAITKVGYGDIHDQLDNFLVALDLVEKGSKHLTQMNNEVQFAARMGRSGGIGARGEYGNLPTAGASTDARASIYLRYQYGRIQGTGQVFEQVTGNTTAFVDWMQREMKDIKESLQRDLSRQVYGDGTGTLALLTTGTTAATTLTVDDVHWLEVGMTIDILTAATLGNPVPTKANGSATATITAINTTTKVVTTDQTVTAATGSALVRADIDAVENSWNKEWQGLGLIVSTTSTLHTIVPATYPKWKAGYVEASVGTLAELDLTHLVQGIWAQGGKVTDFLTSMGVVNAYWNILQGLRRYNGNDNLKGGATKPVFQSAVGGDIPITIDPMCPVGTLYGINKEELYLHRSQDWAWMDKDGSLWNRVANKHAYEATIWQFSNIGTFRRNTHGKLTGITEV